MLTVTYAAVVDLQKNGSIQKTWKRLRTVKRLYTTKFPEVLMIAFSIMMCFVSFITLMVAISLLRGNISSVHGKVFDTVKDKIGYTRQLGKPCLLISAGLLLCGIVAIIIKGSMAIVCAIAVLLVTIVIAAIWFVNIQKHFSQ